MTTEEKKPSLQWRVHWENTVTQLINDNPQNWIFKHPFLIIDNILRQGAYRAAQIGDPVLIDLFQRLALYTYADPTHEDYDGDRYQRMLEEAVEIKKQDPNYGKVINGTLEA